MPLHARVMDVVMFSEAGRERSQTRATPGTGAVLCCYHKPPLVAARETALVATGRTRVPSGWRQPLLGAVVSEVDVPRVTILVGPYGTSVPVIP
eukprot:888866-Rhodomonas_salina.11